MSNWTYINGTITVSPMGRTQAEKRYILDTVLDHLPVVSGSEGDMEVYVIQKAGYNSSSSCDEFGQRTNNLRDNYGDRSRRRGYIRTQDEYILTVDASLRNRIFSETFREFQKWLCRLAKRVGVEGVLVEIKGDDERKLVYNSDYLYSTMFEHPSWSYGNKDGESNWCEYLMWQKMDEYEAEDD